LFVSKLTDDVYLHLNSLGLKPEIKADFFKTAKWKKSILEFLKNLLRIEEA
jgi:hypothetical protein